MSHDIEFTPSSFGGGWIVPLTGDATKELRYFTGERDVPLPPLGGARGWIVEPVDVEPLTLHLREAGYTVKVLA